MTQQFGGSYDIVVIGSGIAGLCAATTAAREGMQTLALTGGFLGGQLLNIAKIDGYPGYPEGVPGFILCPASEEQASEAGAEFAAVPVTGIGQTPGGWNISTAEGACTARAVIIATGASLKTLGLDGEERLFGKGVSHCASCDAPLLRGRPVAVAGGGDSALQEALTLAPVAAKVTIIASGERLTAQKAYLDQIAGLNNVEVRLNSKLTGIIGEDDLKRVRIAGPDGADDTIDVDSLFVFVGLRPNTGWLGDVAPLDDAGFIKVDMAMRTGLPGLYAAGTVRAGSAFRAVAAAGDGAAAALSAVADLRDGLQT